MSIVSIASCASYHDRDAIVVCMRQCLQRLTDLQAIFKPNTKVLLKPNLLSSRRGPDQPCNTHPYVLRAIAIILKQDYACQVFIGESSGGLSYGGTRKAFTVSGYRDIANELGIELVDFDVTGISQISGSGMRYLKSLGVTSFLDQVDVIVSVPKLKTHSLVLFTGALKNMMGVVPGSGKRLMHAQAPRPQQLSEYLVELFSKVKPQLSIMDAVISMEGAGPAAGDPRHLGILLASRDAVAVDAVAAKIIGLNPLDVATTKLAAERGLGIAELDQIEIRGLSLEEVTVKDFKLPISGFSNRVIDVLPNFVLKQLFAGMTSGRPVIINKVCTRCNTCVAACPIKIMSYDRKGNVVIDYSKCIECYCCHELCPDNAIVIKMPYFVRCLRLLQRIVNGVFKILK